MAVVAVDSPFSYLSINFDMAFNRLGDSGFPFVLHDKNIISMQSSAMQFDFRKGLTILERERKETKRTIISVKISFLAFNICDLTRENVHLGLSVTRINLFVSCLSSV